MQLSADRLQEGAASRARPSENRQQLAALEQTVEAVEDLLVLLVPGKQLANPEWRQQHRVDPLLELQGRAGSEDIEVREEDAQFTRFVSLNIQLAYEVPHPLRDVEVCRLWVQGRVRLE